jgi:hypothetical protein
MLFNGRAMKIIKHKVIYDGILRKISKLIARIGLVFKFYYVFKEGLLEGDKKDFGPESGDYEITFLDSEDVQTLGNLEGHDTTVPVMLDQLSEGHRCLGLKNEGKIVGFTWCRYDRFGYPPSMGFLLKENEAYLYDMFIIKDRRGSNLAPLLRYRCYQELAKIGRKILYSASLIPNAPAIRFKKKLDAQILSLCLYIRFGKGIQWNWKLRTYG